MTLRYRPEIDGLRAIAVFLVIFYHAEFLVADTALVAGGFIGVDVFFVISGYLITSILVLDLRSDEFSLARFYERRARRILPALLTVILVSIPAAWMIMLSEELEEYAGSVISALFFGSNFWFLFEDSYTAEPSLLKPFLHTWSLAVEEQFYVLYPLALLAIWRSFAKWMMRIFAAGLVLSLLMAHYGSAHFPDATFFLLPTRGWELLAGAVLAKLEIDHGRQASPVLRNTMPALGVAMILISSGLMNDEMRHPSLITALPVAGTMLVIWFADRGEIVSGVLSSRVLVGVGLISYSLYLWHMPVLAFARLDSIDPLSAMDKTLLVLLCVVLATVTYFLVEKPFRKPAVVSLSRFTPSISAVLLLLVAANVAFVAGAVVPPRSQIMENFYDDSSLELNLVNGEICHNRPVKYSCVFINGESDSNYIALGDSHARVLSIDLRRLSEVKQVDFIQITQDGCLFIPGTVHRVGGEIDEDCIEETRQTQLVLSRLGPSTIVYSVRLPLQLTGERFDNQEGGVELGGVSRYVVNDENAEKGLGISDLVQLAIKQWLSYGHSVVLVYPVPEVGWDLPRYIAKKMHAASEEYDREWVEVFDALSVTTSYDLYKQRTKEARRILDGIGEHPRVFRVYPDRLFCSEVSDRCYTHDDSHLYYYDEHHLSRYGAKIVVDKLESVVGD